MTVKYLDPINGDDAKDGLSFVNRKKTIASVCSGYAAGDEIRIIASPDPVNIGSVQWTDNSRTLTIPAGKVKLIDDCHSAWTQSTNVTSANSASKKSSNAGNVFGNTIATAFTTGKVAYRALGATADLSGFEFISFWLSVTSVPTNGALELRLCSDTTGDVVVHSIPLDSGNFGSTGNAWRVAWKDFGTALSSNINSIALYASSDPATSTVIIENIIATRTETHADHLSHLSLFGKNTTAEPEWYPVGAFLDATTLLIGASNAATENTPSRPYRGTTESVATYVVKPLRPDWSTANRTFPTTSPISYANPIYVTGGWDRTAMAAQSGITWLSGAYSNILQAFTYSGAPYIFTSKLGFAHYTQTATFPPGKHQIEGCIGCDPGSSMFGASLMLNISIKQIWGYNSRFAPSPTGPLVLQLDRVHGCINNASSPLSITNDPGMQYDLRVGKIDNNASYGLLGVSASSGRLRGTVFANNATADIGITTSGVGNFLNGVTLGTTPVVFTTGADIHSFVHASNIGGDPTNHAVWRRYWTASSDTSVRHTASDFSWRINPTDTTFVQADFPAELELAKVACQAGSPVTVTCWVRRDDTGLAIGIKAKGGFLPGAGDLHTDFQALAAGAANTWEQVSITFTPTAAGVIPIYGVAYGGSTYNGWFDDLTVSQ